MKLLVYIAVAAILFALGGCRTVDVANVSGVVTVKSAVLFGDAVAVPRMTPTSTLVFTNKYSGAAVFATIIKDGITGNEYMYVYGGGSSAMVRLYEW